MYISCVLAADKFAFINVSTLAIGSHFSTPARTASVQISKRDYCHEAACPCYVEWIRGTILDQVVRSETRGSVVQYWTRSSDQRPVDPCYNIVDQVVWSETRGFVLQYWIRSSDQISLDPCYKIGLGHLIRDPWIRATRLYQIVWWEIRGSMLQDWLSSSDQRSVDPCYKLGSGRLTSDPWIRAKRLDQIVWSEIRGSVLQIGSGHLITDSWIRATRLDKVIWSEIRRRLISGVIYSRCFISSRLGFWVGMNASPVWCYQWLTAHQSPHLRSDLLLAPRCVFHVARCASRQVRQVEQSHALRGPSAARAHSGAILVRH